VFLYIDKHKVASVGRDSLDLVPSVDLVPLAKKRTLTREKLAEIASDHKKDNYLWKETFLFHISIEPEVLPLFHEDSYKNSWSAVSHTTDLFLPPSIFVFHPYNTLYFIYYEVEDVVVVVGKPIKSSLKTTSSGGKATKKVRWSGNHRVTRGKLPLKPPIKGSGG
jgi:hypothetical protein